MAKQPPEHIQAALALLNEMDEQTRKAYRSSLPRHAKALFEDGQPVDINILRRQLADGLIAEFQANKTKTYESIISAFRRQSQYQTENNTKQKAGPLEGVEINRNKETPLLIIGGQNVSEHHQNNNEEINDRIKKIVDHFITNAREGDIEECERLIKFFDGVELPGWSDALSYGELVEPAFQYGHLDMLKHIVPHLKAEDEKSEGELWRITAECGHAIARGDMAMMRYVCEDLGYAEAVESKYSDTTYTRYVDSAMQQGHWECIAYCLPGTLSQLKNGKQTKLAKELFEDVCQKGNTENIDKLLGWGLRAKHYYNYEEELYYFAKMKCRNDAAEYVFGKTDFLTKDDVAHIYKQCDVYHDQEVINVLSKYFPDVPKPKTGVKRWLGLYGTFLLENFRGKIGVNDDIHDHANLERAEILGLPRFMRGSIANGIERNTTGWQRMGIEPNSFHLKCKNPARVSKKTFEYAWALFQQEGLMEGIAAEYAYHTAALFRTPDRILQYLEKWGSAAKQPLHDITHMIQIPQKGDFDAKSWGDAVLQHGPKMAKLVAFADRIAQPLKSEDGKVYSYTKTKAETAKYIYKKARLYPEFAAACHEQGYKEFYFNAGVKQIKAYQRKYASNDNQKPGDHIPDLTIEGDAFGMEGCRFRKLADGDYKGLLLGAFTDCCQHLASAGHECAKHGFLSEHSGFYVVEDTEGDIIAQSWAWRGKDGELVFDSLESLKDRIEAKNWKAILNGVKGHIKEKRPDITAFNIGAGGKTPSLSLARAKTPAQPINYNGYRDSELQYCAYQKAATGPEIT